MKQPKLSRRKVLVGGVALSTLALPGIVRSADKPEQLVVSDPGGLLHDAYQIAYYDTFTAKTGIKIVATPLAGLPKLKLMVESDAVDVDVIDMEPGEGAVASKQGYLDKIDWSLTDRSTLLPNTATADTVSSTIAAQVLSWNTEAVGKDAPPSSWADLFDSKRYSGKRCLSKLAERTLEIALLGDGVAVDKLYPLDVERALKKLDTIKSDIVWWDQGAQGAQLLVGGEASIGSCWNGRVYPVKKEGAPVDFTFNQAIFQAGVWVMPKGGKNEKWAQQFIANALLPENQAKMSKVIPYIGNAKDVLKFVSPEARSALPDVSKGFWEDISYWANNPDTYDKFNRWLLG
ncbi:ABC transporter substrate-binding protein [Mesorhizobium sp. M4B.F.Ca.ET.190.01.1.1]|uniref:ABC transporter substrate-binding protein n=1 Tax=unclassified Mesorhizobium TaxID=325217 RepID=UPI001092DBEE|nr:MULTISPECIES: ABC transporter substrate-binding protein [unclassified Mesorhizobium]TGR10534.1 ABC transporter substrate-binding protein [Mesorhizobium sp. M4B.F.Ca.ET.200.01.1.1]TGS19624.1 ABC transporter substrate-binding protein [Mesorhizobium sp. M4B.F.Ca.ET.190.01.1.1]TGT32410.1 ABC transporter substrate-binding protein [Mesorhizobium sp. M4B.F.Ca.ET.172.01.1.1]